MKFRIYIGNKYKLSVHQIQNITIINKPIAINFIIIYDNVFVEGISSQIISSLQD
jgi:hypothetical protein